MPTPAPASYTLSWSADHATSCTLTRNGATLKTTHGNGSHNEYNLHMLVTVPQRILPSRLCFRS